MRRNAFWTGIGVLAAEFLLVAGEALANGYKGGREAEGDEFTGVAAAWVFVLANLGPALAVLVRLGQRYRPVPDPWLEQAVALRRALGRWLRPMHYYGNLLAVVLALAHWRLSWCGVLSVQKWGLVLLAAWACLGLALKFRLAPVSLRPRLYKLHAYVLLPALFFVLVLIGHGLTE